MADLIPFRFERMPRELQLERARARFEESSGRRSVREFSPEPLPDGLLEWLVRTAGTAPSGANKQPWRFVAVTDAALKREIRIAAEEEERRFYEERATPEWLADLEPIGTDWRKPFLETAPVLVVLFQVEFEPGPSGIQKHYYVKESVGLAAGMFIAAVHHAGLVTLTHTPSPMGFLGRILGRPANERPFLLLPVGYPADHARVPNIGRKPLEEILTWNVEGAPRGTSEGSLSPPKPKGG
jgi:iodotyrosine deiodinase